MYFWYLMLFVQESKETSNSPWWQWDEFEKEKRVFTVCLPMGGVASVCRPTIWAGPSPSRKSLNWLSGPRRVVGKTNLRDRGYLIVIYGHCMDGWVEELRLGYLRSIRTVWVGAAISRVLAALPCYSVPHLHSDASLRAPPDRAPKLLCPTV